MITEQTIIALIETIPRIIALLLLGLVTYWIIAQHGNCPHCGENLDLKQTSTRVAP